jgi:hypothetical protein
MLRERSAGKHVCCVLILAAVAMSQTTSQAVSLKNADRIVSPVQRIAGAMDLAGLSVNPDQIELLSGTGNPVSASMQVVSMTEAAAGSVKVKLRCRDNRKCLPFYVLVHGVDPAKVGGARAPRVAVAEASPAQNIVRGGDHAILILEGPDSRMSFPVICLQGGARGQRVRVTSPDRKRFYFAEVLAPGILKGNL